MLLSSLLSRYGVAPSPSIVEADLTVTTITADSRQVQPGSIFVAQRGLHHDGADFIPLAIISGATAIVTRHTSSKESISYRWEGEHKSLVVGVNNPAHFLAIVSSWLMGPFPEHIVAITGTNGKSSTADFLRQLWHLRGEKSASIGTLGVITNSSELPSITSMTTPDAVTLSHTLSTLHRHKITHVALEASSHGLHQYRLDGIPLTAAGFTNLTRDHLDYHNTLEDYRDSKIRLFQDLLPSGSISAINADMDPITRNILYNIMHTKEHILRDIGERASSIHILHVQPTPQGQIITLALNGQKLPDINLPFPGRFQVDNALMAAALCWKNDADAKNVLALLTQLRGVPGRCELVAELANGATAYVDYAHTPDALEHALLSLRPHTTGKLHVIFGAGGNRDKGKRPLMGQVAAHLADRVIITDDNPRLEDPTTIRKAIFDTCPHAQEIGDRHAAIAYGLRTLAPGDILLIAGKGHESGQIIGTTTHPFDDRLVTRSLAETLSS